MDAKRNSYTTDREIVLTRDLDAPRELAWKAMTSPRTRGHKNVI